METSVDAFLDGANTPDITINAVELDNKMTNPNSTNEISTDALRKKNSKNDNTAFVCKSSDNLALRCIDVNGRPAWQGIPIIPSANARSSVHNFMDAKCPVESRSWRTQLLCDLKPGETSKCYKFAINNNDSNKRDYNAICVTGEHNKELKLSSEGYSMLLQPNYATQGDVPISPNSSVFDTLQPCYMQTFVGLSTDQNTNVHTTALTLYTKRDDMKACKAAYTEAMRACDQANNNAPSVSSTCASKIKRIFPNKPLNDTYRCLLDPDHIPDTHDKNKLEWYDWVQEHKSDTCVLTTYSGHTTHTQNQANQTLIKNKMYETTKTPKIQRDVCSLPLNTNDTHNSKHNRVRRQTTYHIPTPCELKPDNSTSYCGKIGAHYTGHCASYTQDGKLLHGCKPFSNELEIQKFRSQDRERAKSLSGNATLRNALLHYPKLRVCTAGDLLEINTQKVCKHTTTALSAERDSVVAKNHASAVEQCNSNVFQIQCNKKDQGCISNVFYTAVASDNFS